MIGQINSHWTLDEDLHIKRGPMQYTRQGVDHGQNHRLDITRV